MLGSECEFADHRIHSFSIFFLVIPDPGHDEVGEGCEDAIPDNCNDIDHVDSLPARAICRTIFRRDSLISKRDARKFARASIGGSFALSI